MTIKSSYPVTGMSCASCALHVEEAVRKQEGVKSATVNFAASAIWIEYDPEIVRPSDFQKAVQSAGYNLLLEEQYPGESEEMKRREFNQLKKECLWAAILTVPVVIIGMVAMDKPYAGLIMLILSSVVVFRFGRRFFVNAIKQVKNRKANMDSLVAMSIGTAWAFSFFNLLFPVFLTPEGTHPLLYFEASSVIVLFILFGRLLEEKAKSSTYSALKKLMGMQPDKVHAVQENGADEEKHVSLVQVGDLLRVKPGERIPVDGTVVSGTSYVDESSITGEPMPARKNEGDPVYTGTINQKGSFILSAGKIGSETLLSQIIKTVREAQGSKAPVQRMVDRVAAVFVPAVIIAAVLSLVIWLLLGGSGGFENGLQAFLSVLVIACPCALGLATPTAVMAGIGKGAAHGILIRDAAGLEQACRTNTVVLDKTGTLTEGKPVVTDVVWKCEPGDLSRLLMGMEMQSEHPLAEAVVEWCTTKGIVPSHPVHFENFAGKGVVAEFSDIRYVAGNEELMVENGVTLNTVDLHAADSLRKEAKTVIFFGGSGELAAILAVADNIKPSAVSSVRWLKKEGLEIHLLTGDNEETARVMAEKAGIENYKSGMLPAGKADYVCKLQEIGRIVALVGDGINDSQAMAQADVSFAMGKGADIAMDVAKITLVSSDLNAIPAAIRLSRLTVRTIRQNLFWAFIYNIVAIPVAAGTLFPFTGTMLNPEIAGAAMALSSLSVVSNSLRLKYRKLAE